MSATTRDLSRVIAPFVPPSMRYKLHPDVEAPGPIRPQSLDSRAARGPLRRGRGRRHHASATERPHLLLHRCRRDAQLRHFGRGRAQLSSSRQPRPAAAGDRRVPGLPVPAARADRAERRLHARELRDEAPARRSDGGITRLHGRAEERQLGPRRVRLFPDLSPRRRALYAGDAGDAASGLRTGSRSCCRYPRSTSPSRSGSSSDARACARAARRDVLLRVGPRRTTAARRSARPFLETNPERRETRPLSCVGGAARL